MKTFELSLICLLLVCGCVDSFSERRAVVIEPSAVPFEVQDGLRRLDMRMKIEKVVFYKGNKSNAPHYEYYLISVDNYRFYLRIGLDGKPFFMAPLVRIAD
jgi:hypothetical protein